MIYEEEFFIHTSFVDKYDNLRPFAIWELLQATAGNHANILGVGFNDLIKLNLLWVVQYEEYKIVGKLPKYGDRIKIKTWPHEKNRLEYVREYEIYDKLGNLCITAISSWFLINKNTHRLEKGDNVIFNGNYYNHTNYPNYKRRKLNLNPNSDIIKSNYRVLLTDLDHNGHTNNAKYFDMVYNSCDINIKDIKGTYISFVKEALLGENLIIESFKNEDNYNCYRGINENGETSFEIIMEV